MKNSLNQKNRQTEEVREPRKELNEFDTSTAPNPFL
jgi:hypothetical protein